MKRNRRKLGAGWDQMEEIDPMAGVSNLADVMLVFACGLMVALVLRWNVDLGSVGKVDPNTLQDISGSQQITEEALQGDRYQSEGTVYRDTQTGQLYIVTP